MQTAMAKEMKKIALRLSVHTDYKSSEIISFVNSNIALGKKEYEVFNYLVGMANNCNGVAFPSAEYLSKELNVSRPRIQAITKSLKAKGVLFIESIRQGSSNHNFYIIPTVSHLKALVEDVYQSIDEIANNVKESLKEVKEQVTPKEDPKKEGFKPKQSFKKQGVTRTELLPDWFNEV